MPVKDFIHPEDKSAYLVYDQIYLLCPQRISQFASKQCYVVIRLELDLGEFKGQTPVVVVLESSLGDCKHNDVQMI